MKILITGAQGFIGQHLVNNFLEKNYKILIFDRKVEAKLWRMYEWDKNDNVEFFLGDLKDRDAVFEAVYQSDIAVNLGGLLGTQEMMENPIPAVDVNIKGALNLFDACRTRKKRGFQIAVGNYWMNNPYSITKNTTERLALMYNKEHGTDIRICRGMNVYGENQKHRPVRKIFPNLAIPALLGKDITIYGDGEQVMDLIYVKDFVEILSRIILTDNIPNDIIYEAGVGGGMTINWAAEQVIKATNSNSKINHVEMRPGEEKNSIVEISEQGWKDLETHIKYTPKDLTPAAEAIQKSVDWYKKHLEEFTWDE